MTLKTIAAAALVSLSAASPGFAFTYPTPSTPPPAENQAKFADPDAALSTAGSNLQRGFVDNSPAGSGGGLSGISYRGGTGLNFGVAPAGLARPGAAFTSSTPPAPRDPGWR